MTPGMIPYLILEPFYLAELALSNGIGGPLDFIPTFATPDPFLHEIANALRSAPRINDPAGNLLLRVYSTLPAREFCIPTRNSDTGCSGRPDSPTINCEGLSITYMIILERRSIWVLFLEQPA